MLLQDFDGLFVPQARHRTPRIGTDFASLRAALANRTERERSLESELESLAASKQAEMKRTISLRQQGYRRRAFNLVDTNEGRDYMDGARNLVSSLSSAESSSFARFEKERTASQSKALSETIIANSCLLVLAACLFGFSRYHGHVLEADGKNWSGVPRNRGSDASPIQPESSVRSHVRKTTSAKVGRRSLKSRVLKSIP